jgi:hypothetical protein
LAHWQDNVGTVRVPELIEELLENGLQIGLKRRTEDELQLS